jgi:L-fuconolactonase
MYSELERAVYPVDAGPDTRAIFVQADCAPDQGMAEVRWVEKLAWPALAGIVAFAPIEDGAAAQAVLAELATRPMVVGVRRLLQDEPAGFVSEAGFAAGLAAVARRGLVFDATIRAEQLEELAQVHRVVPGLAVVLDHLGNPPLADGLDSAAGRRWLGGITALAANPSAVVKLSGAVAGDAWTGPLFARAALEVLGPDRMLLGSDQPLTVPGHAEAYRLWASTADAALGLNGDERAAVRSGNAIRTYGLIPGGSLRTPFAD